MSGWFQQLRNLLGLGKKSEPTNPDPLVVPPAEPPAVEPEVEQTAEPAAPPTAPNVATDEPEEPEQTRPKRKRRAAKARPQRDTGYLLVIGLDFGTAYTKCVVRDAMIKDPGRAFPVAFNLAHGTSYLFPSVVVRTSGGLRTAEDHAIQPNDDVVDLLKMRLVADTDKTRASPWQGSSMSPAILPTVAWFLAQVLAQVGRKCRERWSDFGEHPHDTCFVNCCVPIAYADGSIVEAALLKALCAARAAVGPAGVESPSQAKIEEVLDQPATLASEREYCYTYPETSANLQCFLKSRARQPGLYLFMDVGAGTVDLSFFQLLANESDEAPLRYYHAAVLDAGSSMLELKSLKFEPRLDRREVLAYKEGALANPSDKLSRAFDRACREIHDYVGKGVGDAVVVTESKLHIDRAMQLRQMRSVKLMFTGGGFCHNPYELAARFFQRARQWNFKAPMTPVPIPDDIEWESGVTPVPFSRLSVAYGLSFPRYDVDGQKFPSQTAVDPNAPRPTRRPEVQAPTKDEV